MSFQHRIEVRFLQFRDAGNRLTQMPSHLLRMHTLSSSDFGAQLLIEPVMGGQGRSHQGKLLVAGAVEVDQRGRPGRLRLARIEDYSAKSLHLFVERSLAPTTIARTDGWSGYQGVGDIIPGLNHQPHTIGPMAAHIVLPWVHRAFSNLKTWGLGVYHGLRAKHLQTYLDEFVFRFNRRRNRHSAFKTILAIAVSKSPMTYNMLISPEQKG